MEFRIDHSDYDSAWNFAGRVRMSELRALNLTSAEIAMVNRLSNSGRPVDALQALLFLFQRDVEIKDKEQKAWDPRVYEEFLRDFKGAGASGADSTKAHTTFEDVLKAYARAGMGPDGADAFRSTWTAGARRARERAYPSSPGPNHWSRVLDVAPDATQGEIELAYRRKRGKAHPDRGGDTAEFQRVKAAYDTAMKQFTETR